MGKFKKEIIQNSGIKRDVYDKVLEKEDREYLEGFWEFVLQALESVSKRPPQDDKIKIEMVALARHHLRQSTDLLGRWWVPSKTDQFYRPQAKAATLVASTASTAQQLRARTKQPDLVNAVIRQIVITRMKLLGIYPDELTTAYSYDQSNYRFQPKGDEAIKASQAFKMMDLIDRSRIYKKAVREGPPATVPTRFQAWMFSLRPRLKQSQEFSQLKDRYWKLIGEESVCFAGDATYDKDWPKEQWEPAYKKITGSDPPVPNNLETLKKKAYYFGINKSTDPKKPVFKWRDFAEAAAVISSRYEDWNEKHANLSLQELEALIVYTTGFATQGMRTESGHKASTGMNGSLRGVFDTEVEVEGVKGLDDRDYLRTLVLLAVSGISKLGGWQAAQGVSTFPQFYRPLARVDADMPFLSLRKSGSRFSDLAFYSTAYDYSGGYALDGPAESKLKKSDEHKNGWKPHVLTIFLPPVDGTGLKRCAIVESLSYFGAGEKEMLFRPGTWFKVITVYETATPDAKKHWVTDIFNASKGAVAEERAALKWFSPDIKKDWFETLKDDWAREVDEHAEPKRFNWMGLQRVYIVRQCKEAEIPKP